MRIKQKGTGVAGAFLLHMQARQAWAAHPARIT
jgi:hypothetical protein